jgi:hypothetical protein
VRAEIELRYLPRFRVMDYLVQAGGEATDILSVVGPGWSAYVEALEPDRVGIVDVPRDRLVIEGDPAAVQRVHAFMYHTVRRMRGGG